MRLEGKNKEGSKSSIAAMGYGEILWTINIKLSTFLYSGEGK